MSPLNGFQIPAVFRRFDWRTFNGQNTQNVTYSYLVSAPVARLRGASSVLYIGKTEQPISKRYKQATEARNTDGNSQATNIRMSHVMRTLRAQGDTIALVFTPELLFQLEPTEVHEFGQMLQTWNKSHYLKSFAIEADGRAVVSVETFLIVHYASEHLEVPPLNHST